MESKVLYSYSNIFYDMVEYITNMGVAIVEQFTDYTQQSFNIAMLAKRLNKPHVSLLPHINSLVAHGIIRQEMRGRNRELSLSSSIVTKKMLEIVENTKTIALFEKEPFFKKVIEQIKDIPHAVVLFGSYAKNTHHSESDIDIAIFGKKTAALEKIFTHIEHILGKTIDVKYISRVDSTLGVEILKNHIVLHNTLLFLQEVFHG